MEFPMEIAHVEEIEEHIVEEEDTDTVILGPETSTVVRAGTTNQKIVLIKTPQGGTRTVRVQASSNAGPSTAVQYVRTDAGLVQVRNAAPRPQVVHRVGSNVVVKDNKYTLAKVPVKPQATTSHQTVTKTITLAQAQQMGLLGHASTTTASTHPAKVVTLNPTIKQEPGTVKMIGQGGVKVRPTATHESQQVIQTPGQSRLVFANKSTPKQANVQYVEESQVVYQARPQPVKRPVSTPRHEEHKVKVSTQTADRLLQLEGSVVIPGHNQSKIVMLPPDYMDQLESKEEGEAELDMAEVVDESDLIEQSTSPTPADLLLDLAAKKRPCNCTKSQCLKLYCECFANGEFCSDCNCRDCFNTIEHEEERQSAIYNCLERNPNAFRPKIGKVSSVAVGLRHHKGCHCKRSGCLKNYCECFEAKIPCTEMCKCVDCKNADDHGGCLQAAHMGGGKGVSAIKRAAVAVDGELRPKVNEDDEPPPKQPYNFMTADVVDATVQCMMAQADECQQNGVSYRNTERLILEEFGRCLAEIIDFSNKNTDNE